MKLMQKQWQIAVKRVRFWDDKSRARRNRQMVWCLRFWDHKKKRKKNKKKKIWTVLFAGPSVRVCGFERVKSDKTKKSVWIAGAHHFKRRRFNERLIAAGDLGRLYESCVASSWLRSEARRSYDLQWNRRKSCIRFVVLDNRMKGKMTKTKTRTATIHDQEQWMKRRVRDFLNKRIIKKRKRIAENEAEEEEDAKKNRSHH